MSSSFHSESLRCLDEGPSLAILHRHDPDLQDCGLKYGWSATMRGCWSTTSTECSLSLVDGVKWDFL